MVTSASVMASRKEEGSNLNRRSYLGLVGAATASTTLVGTATGNQSEYDRVVDIVEAGADNSGGEPIDDVFHDEAQDDTLIKFPEGTYKVNQLNLYRLSHFAMVGDGATLVPGGNYNEEQWIVGSEVQDLRFESFTLDHTADGVAPEIVINALDGLVVRDVTKNGYQADGGTAFAFGATTQEGSALVENLVATDGGQSVGLYCECAGSMTVRNTRLANFEDNGLYASAGDGPVTVEGGRYWNNNVAGIRLGSPGSSVTGATVGADTGLSSDGQPVNMRGIRVADGPGPVRIENCDVRMEGGQGTGGIVGAYSGGSFEVRNTRISVADGYHTVGSGGNATSYGIYVDSVGGDNGHVGSRTFRGVSITGGGSGRAAVLLRRNDNDLQNVCINQSGGSRNGIVFENSRGNGVADSTVDVPGQAFVMKGDSGARLANNSKEGSCPGPGSGDAPDGTDEEPADDSSDQEDPQDDAPDDGSSGDGSDGNGEDTDDENLSGENPGDQASVDSTQDASSTSGDGATSQDGDGDESTPGDGGGGDSASESGGGDGSSAGGDDDSSAGGDDDGCPKT